MAIFTPELLNKLKWGYYFWPMLLLGGLIGTVLNYIYSLWNMKRVLKWIPGPPQVPILGNAVNFIGKPWTGNIFKYVPINYHKISKRYKKINYVLIKN